MKIEYKTLIIIIILCLLFLAVGWNIYSGYQTRLMKVNGKISDLDKVKEIIPKIEAKEKESERVNSILFVDERVLRRLLEQKAQNNRVTILNLNIGRKSVVKDVYNKLDISIDIKASYNDFISFINSLEEEDALMIPSIELNENVQKGVVETKLEIIGFLRKE